MRTPVVILAAFAVGACAGSVATAIATAPAEVRKAADLVRRAPPHGKARVTELARGSQAWVGLLELDAGGAVPEHRDTTEEYLHVIAGSGTVTIDGTVTEIGPGDTIYMPANATVSYKNGPAELRVFQVFAGPEPASKYSAWTPIPSNR